MNNEPTITDALRQALPESLRDEPAIAESLQKLGGLETEYAAQQTRAELERRFLERAPREGLLYPGDALRLENVAEKLGNAPDADKAIHELYRELRAARPYLFAKNQTPPTEKIAGGPTGPVPESIREAWRGGGLTRQVMVNRRILR